MDEKFRMPVPIYLDFGLDFGGGKILRVGAVQAVGNTTVSLTGIAERPKRVLLNYNYDILSAENGK